MTRISVNVVAVVVLGALAPFSNAVAQAPVRVASKKFTESVILGEAVVQLIRAAGDRVEHLAELGGDFNVDRFQHRAVYDAANGRIEMRLVSMRPQCVAIGGRRFEFAGGEAIITEYSHKYTIAGFAEMAAAAGLTLRRTWTDAAERFAVLHFALLP